MMKADFYSQCDYNICKYVFMSGCGIDLHYENLPMQYIEIFFSYKN